MHKDSYPLPRIDDTIDALSRAQWFSLLDLRSGYWQAQLDEGSKEKTDFSTGHMQAMAVHSHALWAL